MWVSRMAVKYKLDNISLQQMYNTIAKLYFRYTEGHAQTAQCNTIEIPWFQEETGNLSQ